MDRSFKYVIQKYAIPTFMFSNYECISILKNDVILSRFGKRFYKFDTTANVQNYFSSSTDSSIQLTKKVSKYCLRFRKDDVLLRIVSLKVVSLK